MLQNSKNVDISGKGTLFTLTSKDEDELSINKFISSSSSSTELKSDKELINTMEIYETITVNDIKGESEDDKSEYKIKNVKLEQGSKLTSTNLKFYSVEIGIDASIGYHSNDFSESEITLYFNEISQQITKIIVLFFIFIFWN